LPRRQSVIDVLSSIRILWFVLAGSGGFGLVNHFTKRVKIVMSV
jgi:hypothetical protein